MSPRRLDELGRRIERLTLAPEDISAPFTRLFRPILYRFGWKPDTEIRDTVELLDGFKHPHQARAPVSSLLEQAVDELEDNIKQAERATVVNRRPLVAHAAWLRRLYELLVRARRIIGDDPGAAKAAIDRITTDREDKLVLTGTESAALLPPLSMSDAKAARHDDDDDGDGDDEDGERGFGADPSRLLELQLDAIDQVLDAARQEDKLLARRRHLLEAARQLLLETNAALPLEQDGVHERMRAIAQGITQLNRMEAVGLRGEVSVLHQARAALSRGERDKLFAALQLLDSTARAKADIDRLRLTSAALASLGGAIGSSGDEDPGGLATSFQQMFGDEVREAMSSGYWKARTKGHDEIGKAEYDNYMSELIADYYAPGQERAGMAAAMAVDGCVNVGGVMSPVRVDEEYRVRTLVRFPTQQLSLVTAEDVSDVAKSVVRDPRTVLLDLATGRLLTRRFVREEIRSRKKTVMAGEVRVYVLDGSTSMAGPRARMRDGILIAELATLMRRLNNPHRTTRTVLFYRYFNTILGDVTRVASTDEAIRAIHDVSATVRVGGTNIERALMASIDRVKESQDEDPDLARAQIVLITDGMAPVSRDRVVEARESLGDLPVGISVIALGEENVALRDIVAEQRSQGQRAFYHFIPDSHLEQISRGEIDTGLPVHLPVVSPGGQSLEHLTDQLNPLLAELADLQRGRERAGLRETQMGGDGSATDLGKRAHLEASFGDSTSLQRRFARWFPKPRPAAVKTPLPAEGSRDRDDLESALVMIATVCEVVELVDSSERARKADAIELVHRLLPNARLTPARYDELVRDYPGALAGALEALHAAARHGALASFGKDPA